MALETVQAGWLSVVPALVAISLAWYTRHAIIGLFPGVVTAAVLYGVYTPTSVGVPEELSSGVGGAGLNTGGVRLGLAATTAVVVDF